MQKHRDFTTWAVTHGIEINGIAAHRFPGRGLGIVAKQKHEVGTVVHPSSLTVPAKYLLFLNGLRHLRYLHADKTLGWGATPVCAKWCFADRSYGA